MYGVMNNVTGEWVPGVYSNIWKQTNDKKKNTFLGLSAMDQSMLFGSRTLTQYSMTTEF